MLMPTVQLRSGGYLVINQTEALVAIDVNSGRSTRERNIEETALQDQPGGRRRGGPPAAPARPRRPDRHRLHRHGGEASTTRMVERRLKEALKNDRARIQVGHISHFGLMEMSRQRLRPSARRDQLHPVPALRRHRPCPQHRERRDPRAARDRGGGRQAPRRRDHRARRRRRSRCTSSTTSASGWREIEARHGMHVDVRHRRHADRRPRSASTGCARRCRASCPRDHAGRAAGRLSERPTEDAEDFGRGGCIRRGGRADRPSPRRRRRRRAPRPRRRGEEQRGGGAPPPAAAPAAAGRTARGRRASRAPRTASRAERDAGAEHDGRAWPSEPLVEPPSSRGADGRGGDGRRARARRGGAPAAQDDARTGRRVAAAPGAAAGGGGATARRTAPRRSPHPAPSSRTCPIPARRPPIRSAARRSTFSISSTTPTEPIHPTGATGGERRQPAARRSRPPRRARADHGRAGAGAEPEPERPPPPSRAEPEPCRAGAVAEQAAEAGRPAPEPANDTAPELQPIIVGAEAEPAADKKRGWWRR